MTGAGRPQRVTVAITGATGAVLGVRCLERLREFSVETHLVISPWGARTIEHELGCSVAQVRALADVVHRSNDQSASISSGSFLTDAMIVAPCSVKTMAAIAAGFGSDLICRAADVMLKERRPLVLMVREAPFHAGHLENMLRLARLGAVILPPQLTFYHHPENLDDVVDHVVSRALDQIPLHSADARRWDGVMRRPPGAGAPAEEGASAEDDEG